MNSNDEIALIISFFIPPLGVLISKGIGTDLILNILFTMFGVIPGVIHAIYVILHKYKNY